MRPLSVAIQGKGVSGLIKRAREIRGKYGMTHHKISQGIDHFAGILNSFGCGGTFAVPGVVLARNNLPPAKYQSQNIEFALHGYHHVDHTRMSYDEHLESIGYGLRLFKQHGLECLGFRSPYLRWSPETLSALREAGFLYDSSQGIAWDVGEGFENGAYQHVLEFYRAKPASKYLSLPYLEDGLVQIPYSLPDDEAFENRLHIDQAERRSEIWLSILNATYQSGELFGLGLHPERIFHCEKELRQVLRSARDRSPGIWIATLGEIASWWKDRMSTEVSIRSTGENQYQLGVVGPEGITLLVRGVTLDSNAKQWDARYQVAPGSPVNLIAPLRPFVGVSPYSAPQVVDFLTQQGYLVEVAPNPEGYGIYLDLPYFSRADERSLVAEIEAKDIPLVRLSRWPHGARSALSISGDIEGYTIWDFSWRLLEKWSR